MEIKPLFETGTIDMKISTVKTAKIEKSKSSDPSGVIPSGIFKVIKWEKFRQIFTISLTSIVLLFGIILATLYGTKVYDVSWIAYLLPITIILLSGYKLMTTYFEYQSLVKSVKRYRENLKVLGAGSNETFIQKLYKKLHTKQIAHNWLTFVGLFYGGIITLLLWWLKDSSWWIFDFKSWIHAWFGNPDLMVGLFTILLVSIATLHIVLSIQRKKRILDIDLYLGERLISTTDLETLKTTRNKAYRRLFVISLMIFLVIPMLVKITLKVLRKK